MENKITLTKADVKKIKKMVFSKRDNSNFDLFYDNKNLYITGKYIKRNTAITTTLKLKINTPSNILSHYFYVPKQNLAKFNSDIIIDFDTNIISNELLKIPFNKDNKDIAELEDFKTQTFRYNIIANKNYVFPLHAPEIILNSETFLDICNKTKMIVKVPLNSCGSTEIQDYLFFDLHNDNINVMYTNGYELFEYKIKNEKTIEDTTVVIGIELLNILKNLKPKNNKIIILQEDSNIYIKYDNYLFMSNKPIRKMPHYKNIIDNLINNYTFQINNTLETRNRLKAMENLMDKDEKKYVTIEIQDNIMKVIPYIIDDTKEISIIQFDIAPNKDKNLVKIGLDLHLLNVFLSNVKQEKLIFHTNTNNVKEPIKVVSNNNKDFLFLIMQVKLDN